jgi:hypothetical protein
LTNTTFGIPDTLPPLGLHEVFAFLWLGFTGLLLLTLALFPHFFPFPWGGLLVLVCWLALPVSGLIRRCVRKAPTDGPKRISAQIRLYTLIVVSFGVGFTLWARHLGLPWPVVIGALFFIEALPSLIVSVTEWWRLSTIGLSAGLMSFGFGFPFVDESRTFVLLGGAVFMGSLLSAGILYWQLSRYHAKERGG